MALTKCSEINVIKALADEPPLTATQLKAKFDEGSNIIKGYINETLTVQIDETFSAINGTLGDVTDQLAGVGEDTVINLLSQKQNNVTYGTVAPSEGENGDVYLRYS